MAPTNLLRPSKKAPRPAAAGAKQPRAQRREILIRAGDVVIRARLLATPTADHLWAALPIYTTAETWGAAIHCQTPVESGRETGAKSKVTAGEIAFWCEEDRIIIGFGKTPLSKTAGEIALPVPCNVWAAALDDVAALAGVAPGARVAVLQADS
jgi:uncharacterized protein